MNGFLSAFWSDLVTAIGLLLTLAGLVAAILLAWGAKSASEAAKDAANKSRSQMSRELQLGDLQRTIGLINSIQILQRVDRWEASTALYPWLAAMLTIVIGHCPPEKVEIRENLSTLRASVVKIDDPFSGRNVSSEIERDQINRTLNLIQTTMYELESDAIADSRGK